MRKWVLPSKGLVAAIVISLAVVSCIEVRDKQTTLKSPTPEARATVAPTPTSTSVPSPTSTPSPQPTPTPIAPELPEKGRPPLEAERSVSATEIERGNTKRQEIALTFDAGAGAAPTSRILSALERHKVPATMFLTGQWAETNPDLVKQIVAQGHEVANHSYSHPAFTGLTDGQMREELARTEAIVQALTGRSTKPFFRPPFGDRDTRVREVMSREGYFTVFWTLDSTDWRPEATAATVRERVLRLSSAGTILVFHLGSEATREAIEEIIVGLRGKGFSLVSLSRLLSE